jgi:hypothetical protein
MKKWFVVAAALVILGVPAAYAALPSKEKPKPATAAQAQGADESAANDCKKERESSGLQAFRKKYGTNHNLRNAHGKCVSAKSKDDKDEKDEDDKDEKAEDDDKGGKSSGAATACKAERASIGAEAFAKKYGTNHNLNNAFGKCVSGKAKDDEDEKNGEKDND